LNFTHSLLISFIDEISRHTSSSLREPENDNSSYIQKLYHGPIRSTNNGYYQQAIYEDEGMDYAAPFPVYAPVLGKTLQKDKESPELVNQKLFNTLILIFSIENFFS